MAKGLPAIDILMCTVCNVLKSSFTEKQLLPNCIQFIKTFLFKMIMKPAFIYFKISNLDIVQFPLTISGVKHCKI